MFRCSARLLLHCKRWKHDKLLSSWGGSKKKKSRGEFPFLWSSFASRTVITLPVCERATRHKTRARGCCIFMGRQAGKRREKKLKFISWCETFFCEFCSAHTGDCNLLFMVRTSERLRRLVWLLRRPGKMMMFTSDTDAQVREPSRRTRKKLIECHRLWAICSRARMPSGN